MSHHDVAYLHHLNQCPLRFEVPIPKFMRYSPDKIFSAIRRTDQIQSQMLWKGNTIQTDLKAMG